MAVVVMFPGQGVQSPAMGAPWRETAGWQLVEEAAERLDEPVTDCLLGDAPERTADAQLAVFLTSLLAWQAAKDDVGPVLTYAGHSLGQLTALVAAGALSFAEGVHLVARRGQLTQAVADRVGGRMAVLLGAAPEQAQAACQAAPGECWVANDNAPGQIVVAGTDEGVTRAGEAALAAGARKIMPLRVGGAFHTPLMAPAADAFAEQLAVTEFTRPTAPVVSNADARAYMDSGPWGSRLASHLVRPVLWRQSLHTMVELGATRLVEVGPGGVLAGLAKRTVPDVPVKSVSAPEDVGRLEGAAA